MKKESRLSNFELLRIVSIVMIIFHHYSVHGCWNKVSGITFNNALIDFLAIGGKIGVSCFILIAGYFGIKSTFQIKKIIKLLLQVLFYSIVFFCLFSLLNFKEIIITSDVFIKSFMPVTFSLYWFLTSYIVLYLFSPFINKLVNVLTENELIKLIIILLFFGYFVPTFTTGDFGLGIMIQFITLYILGAYIKLYNDKKVIKRFNILKLFILCFLLIFCSQLVLEGLSFRYNFLVEKINFFVGFNKIGILICSVLIFLYFKDLKIQNKFINIIAKASLGIYLIHDNYFVRIYLWKILLNNSSYYNSDFLFVHVILSVVFVFVSCCIVELLRIKFLEDKILFIVYNLFDKVIVKIKSNKLYNYVYKKI